MHQNLRSDDQYGHLNVELFHHGLLDLDAALEELSALDERQARFVELRFFGGLSLEESARSLRVSIATASRDWAMAKAWLYRRLKASGSLGDL